nr:TonB-dependent receptor [uncultured Albidiferax sp.]
MNRPMFRPAPLALAIALAIGCPAIHAQSPNTPVQLNIAAQPLGQALNDWARQTRIELIAPPALVAGRSAPAVSGQLTPQQALDRLLAGSGLVAQHEGGAVVIRSMPSESGTTTLPAVVVTAKFEADSTATLQQEGPASDGYRVKTISSVGALGSMSLQDTPFSMSVVPRELMQNIQAQSPDDVYKLNPSTRTTVPQVTSWSPAVNIRGFDGYNTAEDGLRRSYNHAAVVEDKERIEVLNGLAGFLYGAAAPGGMVNFVYKRPTIERLNSVTVGNYGGSQAYVHGDFGGRIDEAGRAGYRLNLVKQEGSTVVDDQQIDRQLVSAAIDWQLTDQLLLELNGVYNRYKTTGSSAYWYFNGVPHGSAPDAKKLWSQPWIHDEFENTKLMGKLSYRVNDAVTLRGAYMRDYLDRLGVEHTVNSVSTAGSFNQIRTSSGHTKDIFDASSVLADISLNTGPVAHKFTLGYYMYSDKYWDSPDQSNTGWQGPYTFARPTYVPEPSFPARVGEPQYAGRDTNKNYLVGDNITFNEQWSVLAGINHSKIQSGVYNKSRNSPSFSLIFKPMPWLTTYATYIEGLEIGGTAPDGTSNATDIQPPMVSRQKEVGVKATVGKLLLTAAIFDIEKAYEFTDSSNLYTQSGRQNHKGIEFNASGKLDDKWTVVGGVTALDAKVKGSEFDGNSPNNVAKVIAKIYSECALPLPGLSLTGGLYYTGKQWADAANTDRLAAVTTADIGMRYATQASGKPLTLRLNVSNLTNKSYWLNSYYVGAPRSIAFSAQLQF